MRLAFLCKRHYTGKDVIADRFGRLYEMPRFLAERGHHVRAYCLDYHGADGGSWTHATAAGSLQWMSHSIRFPRTFSIAGYPHKLLRELHDFSPDVVIGSSDIPNIVLAAWLARKLKVPSTVDLYDNFESFGQASIPGFRRSLRSATRAADLVIAVSDSLARRVVDDYRAKGTVITVPNGVDTDLFRPRPESFARQELGLPASAKLIGTAGGLSRKKGIDVLYSAWATLAATRDDIHLVLAGPRPRGPQIPQDDRVHYLGNLSHARVAKLFNALDVGVVTVSNNAFGRFCWPQKAYEMLASGLPIVATDVGVMTSLLAETPELLYAAGDADALARSLSYQLDRQIIVDERVKDWESLLTEVDHSLSRLVLQQS